MTLLTSTFFYDRKIRIAILTLATFAAAGGEKKYSFNPKATKMATIAKGWLPA